MERSLAELVEGCRCVAIIGMEKNAGKTTVLNQLISNRPAVVQAITSIGYDGEDTDQVTGTGKPSIYVGCGTLVATASGLLGQCDFTRELLRFTGFHTPMGEVVIVRALSDGYAQIAGPSTTVQMGRLVDMLQASGAEQVFIDGAAARKSTAAISSSDACILATGAAFSHDIRQIVEQTQHQVELLTLPAAAKNLPQSPYCADLNDCLLFNDQGEIVARACALEENCADMIVSQADVSTTALFKGVVTQKLIQRLLDKSRSLAWLDLVAEDGTRFMISSQQRLELRRRLANLRVIHPANLLAVTINPTSPSGLRLDTNELRRQISANISLPVFDVMASENCHKTNLQEQPDA